MHLIVMIVMYLITQGENLAATLLGSILARGRCHRSAWAQALLVWGIAAIVYRPGCASRASSPSCSRHGLYLKP